MYAVSFFIFILLISKHYFSEKHFKFVNKSRSSYTLSQNKNDKNLPLLLNNTNNIIVYKNDLEEYKKKRKKRIWEELISNVNE